MAKIAVLTDIHFGVKKNSDIFLKSQMDFFTEQFIPYLEENNIQDILFLGDLFDNRNNINTKVMNDVYELFSNKLNKFNIILLIGNHDSYFNTNLDINSLKFFKNFKNVTLIEKMTTLNVQGLDIVFVPWITDDEEFKKEIVNYSNDVCMGHFELKGFSFSSSNICLNGMSDENLSNFKLVFSGHFHTRSVKKVGNNEIIYIGTPFQITRADIGEDRGFVILDTETLKYEFINNNASMKFIKINYPDIYDEDSIKGNHIDIYVDYTEYDEVFEKYINKIQSLNPIQQPNIFINYSDPSSQLSEIDIDESKIGNVQDLMGEYLNLLTEDSFVIENKDDLQKKILTLYNETKSDLK